MCEAVAATRGIEVVDVRVKRIDLPTEVASSVYDRMNSEREIEARQYRAQGRELGLGVVELDNGIRMLGQLAIAAPVMGMEVTGIRDVTPIPHNGCRPPKRRRV